MPRFVAAVALNFTPVMLGNLIFADRFRDVGSSTVAFGTNLLGAIAGGVLEYGALIVGYRALLIGVAGLYALALVSGRPSATARDGRRPYAESRGASRHVSGLVRVRHRQDSSVGAEGLEPPTFSL